MRNGRHHYAPSGAHVVAAVLHELLNVEQFDTYADVAESLKRRCARLRIPYDTTTIGDAIRAVEQTGRRIVAPLPSFRKPVNDEFTDALIGRAEAKALYDQFRTRFFGTRPTRRSRLVAL
jgi:hypothetical protein